MLKLVKKIVLVWITMTASVFAQEVQVPSVIKAKVKSIEDRFFSVIQEECPEGLCYPTGCGNSRFVTIDQRQDSSLPGLETEATTTSTIQYKLSSVRCEFTYEPSMSQAALNKLKRRLQLRVKEVGVQVLMQAKKLEAKAPTGEIPEDPMTQSKNNQPFDPKEALYNEVLPFIPWILVLLALLFSTLVLIWGFRRLAKPKPRDPKLRTRTSDFIKPGEDGQAEPSPQMILTRIDQIKKTLTEDNKLVEFALRPHFEKENFDELCLFLKHFGPDYLVIFREKAEFRDGMAKLSQIYNESEEDATAIELWRFLDRLERSLVAAKVKLNNEPLEEEFAFLAAISVNELLPMLKEVSHLESVAAISYAPRELRENFFALAPPQLTSKIVEELTKVDRLPDSFVRETARKLRRHYNEHAKDLKTVRVQSTPLIEGALNQLKESARKQLIESLIKENPDAIENLAPYIFLDESLLHLDSESLTEAFLEVPPKDAATYLLNFEWREKVIERLNQRLQDSIRHHLKTTEGTSEAIVSAVRGRIASFVKRKNQAGHINLKAINQKLLSQI